MKRLFLILLVLAVITLAVGAATFYQEPLWVNDQIIRLHLRSQNVQSEYVDVDGYKIHYFEAVPPARLRVMSDGPPLVLIHGLGSRAEDWSGMIPTLADAGFHVYAPDLPGYGRSSKPDVEYSISLQEKAVAGFMKAVHLEMADIGGWSMGGWVALKLTLDHPELVKRVVVYDSVGIYFPPTFNASFFTPKDAAGVARLAATLSPHPKPLARFVSDAAVRRLQENGWVIERSVYQMETGKDLLDFRLQQIERPVLIVWGSEDRLVPLSVGEQMHRLIPHSSMLIVQGCGHLAPGECSQPVLEGTLKFLRAYPRLMDWEKTLPGDAH